MPRDVRRLRRLATYRSRLERIQELKLAAARRATMERVSALQNSQERLDAMLALGHANHGQVDPVVLESGSGYLVRVGREISARSAALRHFEMVEERERQQVLERRRDRRAMESLVEAESVRLAEEQRKAGAASLDEHARTTWWRQQQ